MFPEQKPKSSVLATSKLILAAVILISISMVLGVAGYLAMNKLIKNPEPQISITPEASPSPIVKDETADWKTYRNEKYGYEVKYSNNWNEKESSYNNTGILFLNTNKEIVIGGAAPDDFFSADGREINPKYTNDWIGIQIDTYPKPANFSWDSWIKSNFSVIEKYEKFNYKDLTGIKITELSGIFYGDPSIFIEGDKIYNIKLFNEYQYNTERDIKRDELALNYFNQILSTFKFIENEEIKDVALGFCTGKGPSTLRGNYTGYISNLLMNFDNDKDKEIAGVCSTGSEVDDDKEGLLFVLDLQNGKYESVLEEEGQMQLQRFYDFKNLEIQDVDKDRIDEIIYEGEGWSMSGGDHWLKLYSPKYKEWFSKTESWSLDESDPTGEKRIEKTDLSPNLKNIKYQMFKEFLIK